MELELMEGPKFEYKGNLATTTIPTVNAPDEYVREDSSSDTREKIIGKNTLRPIAILEKILQISKSVVLIDIPAVGFGSGFMITPDILLTNNHVLPSKNEAKDAIIKFNYQIKLSGEVEQTDYYRCDISFFHTNAGLDYSIVKIHGSPGNKWGYIHLPPDSNVDVDDDIFIIQHPGGTYKHVALSGNTVRYKDDTVIQYLTDTLPGSSGSPVFNDAMHLIALHHSGGYIKEPTTGLINFCNEGIKISAILKDIPAL